MKIYLFSDFSGHNIGGMEIHQEALLKYYPDTILFVKDDGITAYCNGIKNGYFRDMDGLSDYISSDNEKKRIFFFNNMSWLTDIKSLRENFHDDVFIMRSGGNDIYKALNKTNIKTLKKKLSVTADIINNYIDRLIINSDYSYFRNIDIGIIPRKMIKIRGGADTVNMEERTQMRKYIDQKYGTYEKKILVIASRFVPFKGIPEFIDSFAADSVNKQYHLFVIGEGVQKSLILEKLKNKLNSGNWTYFGKKSNAETLKLISAADLFVNPSLEYHEHYNDGIFIHTETMGRGMMEAIMQGIPVLAFDSGGTAELFYENSRIGCLANDYKDMMKYLSEFASKGYMQLSETDYSWNTLFKKYDELFDSLMNPKKVPYIFALDYDGTIKTDYCSEEDISNIMKNCSHTFICITARSKEEAVPLLDVLPFRFVVYENGAGISSSNGKKIYWNKLATEEKKKGYTEHILEKLQKIVECKQTHPFTIHLKKDTMPSETMNMINEIIGDMPFQIIESQKFIKIQHKIFNKKSALDYILKDIGCTFTVGAGNGLNDVDFVMSCDIGSMDSKLIKSISCENDKIIPFEKDEAGIKLLEKIISVK